MNLFKLKVMLQNLDFNLSMKVEMSDRILCAINRSEDVDLSLLDPFFVRKTQCKAVTWVLGIYQKSLKEYPNLYTYIL